MGAELDSRAYGLCVIRIESQPIRDNLSESRAYISSMQGKIDYSNSDSTPRLEKRQVLVEYRRRPAVAALKEDCQADS